MNAYPDHLWSIKLATDRAIGALRGALSGMLNTEDDFHDSLEARDVLTRALHAANALGNHLEANYEFSNGNAERKEATCG